MSRIPPIPAIEQARRIYAAQGLDLSEDLTNYARAGCLFVTPTHLMLGRPINRAAGLRWALPGEPVDTWFVKFALGEGGIEWFVRQMPFPLPFVAWSRDFKHPADHPGTPLRFYSTARLREHLNAA